MQPLSGNQRPDLLTSLMNMSFVLRLPREMHLCRSSSNVPRLPSFLEMLQNLRVLLTFAKAQNRLRLPRKTTSEPSKVVRACGVFNILTWKCASRHTGVHFFDISSSKSAPTLVCFVHDLEMCFVAPSQLPKVVRTWCLMSFFTWKCASRHNGVHFFDIATSRTAPKLRCFAHFDLEMCFALQRRATFHFSSGQMAPHPAALARLLFDPLEPQIIGQTQ